MDVIIIGVYSATDKEMLNDVVSTIGSLEIVWEYQQYNTEASNGIGVLEEVYKLFQIGILVEKDREQTFSSYPLIYEVSEAFIKGEIHPKLFQFFDKLEEANIKKMIIAFADEWEKNTLVKVEKCRFQMLKKRLTSIFVWCEGYRNLISNTEIRDDYHPLLLEVESA